MSVTTCIGLIQLNTDKRFTKIHKIILPYEVDAKESSNQRPSPDSLIVGQKGNK